ncbi:hypothetical protein [Schumannella luteola]
MALRGTAAAAGYAAGGVLVVLGALGVSAGAAADAHIDDGAPGMLSLEASALPEWSQQMQPGDSVLWPISAMLEVSGHGELSVEIRHSGSLADDPQGLHLRLRECEREWIADECPTGAVTVVEGRLADIESGSVVDLGEIEPGGGPYFLAELSVPDTMPVELQGTDATIAFGFTASGDTATVTVPGGLPNTGANRLAPLAIGAGVVLVGLVLARQRVLRREAP